MAIAGKTCLTSPNLTVDALISLIIPLITGWSNPSGLPMAIAHPLPYLSMGIEERSLTTHIYIISSAKS